MGPWVKRVLWFVVIAYCIYYMVTRPDDAAALVQGIFNGFRGLFRFFDSLAR